MRQRCGNKNNAAFRNYGGRGIRICAAWRDYVVFRKWAMSHGYKETFCIDRINNDGNYTPSNCQWLTRAANTAKGNRGRKC